MDVKPGVKTTEFYAALAMMLVALLIALGLADPEHEQELTSALANLLTTIAALVSAATVVARYIHGRTALKLRALEKVR